MSLHGDPDSGVHADNRVRKGWSDYGGDITSHNVVWVQIWCDERPRQYVVELTHQGRKYPPKRYKRFAAALKHAVACLGAADDAHR